jgi:Family of unknown function (DUF5681)
MSKKVRSAKRERKQKLTPDVRGKYKKHKLRYRPRGKSFEVGHTVGLATRFKEGNRANPGGRPKLKIISDACRAVVSSDLTEKVQPQTRAEKVASKLFGMAEKGNISAIRELADRCEGRPAITVTGDGSPDKIMLLIEGMTRESARIGHPEGWMPPLLESGVDEVHQEHEEQEEVANVLSQPLKAPK